MHALKLADQNGSQTDESPIKNIDNSATSRISSIKGPDVNASYWRTLLNLFGATFGISSLGFPL